MLSLQLITIETLFGRFSVVDFLPLSFLSLLFSPFNTYNNPRHNQMKVIETCQKVRAGEYSWLQPPQHAALKQTFINAVEWKLPTTLLSTALPTKLVNLQLVNRVREKAKATAATHIMGVDQVVTELEQKKKFDEKTRATSSNQLSTEESKERKATGERIIYLEKWMDFAQRWLTKIWLPLVRQTNKQTKERAKQTKGTSLTSSRFFLSVLLLIAEC